MYLALDWDPKSKKVHFSDEAAEVNTILYCINIFVICKELNAVKSCRYADTTGGGEWFSMPARFTNTYKYTKI